MSPGFLVVTGACVPASWERRAGGLESWGLWEEGLGALDSWVCGRRGRGPWPLGLREEGLGFSPSSTK